MARRPGRSPAKTQVFEDGLGRTHWFSPSRNVRLLIGLVEGSSNLVDSTACYQTLNSSSRPHLQLSSPTATLTADGTLRRQSPHVFLSARSACLSTRSPLPHAPVPEGFLQKM